jgi:hypothetical protein
MPSLLDDAYSTADVVGRMRRRVPQGMPVQTLSGRERRSVEMPENPDAIEASKAMALGLLDVGGIPSTMAGMYSPELEAAMRAPQAAYPVAAMTGAIPGPAALARILAMVPRGLSALAGGTFGMTANSKKEGDRR